MDGLVTLADIPDLGSAERPRRTIVVARLDDNLKDPRYGSFKITQRQVDGWKRNLAETFGRVSIDFDHSSDRGKGTKAAAWITDLQQDGKLVTADVEFTPTGAKSVRDGDYLYISPTFVENYTDEHGDKHGPALIGAALTNRPVLRKGMPTLSLSRDSFVGYELAKPSRKGRKKPRQPVSPSHLPGNPTSSRVRDPNSVDQKIAKRIATLDVSPAVRKKTATLKGKKGGKKKPEFPMPDKKHARLALQFVQRSQDAGNITPADAAKIRSRANGMLGKKGSSGSSLSRDSRGMELTREELAVSLGLPADADSDQILAAACVTLAKFTPAPPTGGGSPAQKNPTANAGASAAAAAANVQSGKASKKAKKNKKAKTMSLSAEETAALITAANAGQAAALQLAEERFEAAWNKALDEGRAAPAQEDTIRALWRENPDMAIKTLDSFVRIVPVKPSGSGEAGPLTGPAPDGMDQERFQLHQEAKQLAAQKRQQDPSLSEADAYTLAAIEIEDRTFAMDNPGI